MRRFALLAILALPVVQAEADSLQAQAVDWEGGNIPESRFIDLHHLRGDTGSFWFNATELRVRTVSSETYIDGPGLSFAGTRWTYAEADYSNALLHNSEGRSEGFVFVVPTAGQPLPTVETTCGNGARPADESVPQVPSQIEQPNPNPEFPLERAVAFTPCSYVTICGALAVVLWDRDVAGTSNQAAVHLESGQLRRPNEPDLRPTFGRAQQLYLTTNDGCFTMKPTTETAVLVESLTLSRATKLVLSGARGVLAETTIPTGSSLELSGALGLRLVREGETVRITELAGADGGRLNGAPLAVAVDSPGGASPAWFLFSLVPMLAVALLLRQRANDPVRLMDRLVTAKGKPSRVVRLATRLIKRDVEKLLAMELRACAWLDLGRPDEALADCQRAAPLVRAERHLRATWALVACRAYSLKGEDQQAVTWLEEAYVKDVARTQDAMRYPEVRRLFNLPGYS